MQNSIKRFSVLAGFAALLLILVANFLLTRRQQAAQTQSQARLSETRTFLYELERTESILKDAETGQRGFLYTADPKYLAPYEQALQQIGSHLATLHNLAVGDAEQTEAVDQIQSLSAEKLGELKHTIDLFRAGRTAEAHQYVTSDIGLLTMLNIRQVVAGIERNQKALESTQRAEYQKSVRSAAVSLDLASLIAIFGLVALAYYIMHEMSLRERHAHLLREREEWFRVTLTSIGDAVIVTNKDGNVSFINPVGESLTGLSAAQVQGRPIGEVFPIFNEFTGAITQNPVSRVMKEGRIVGLANHTVLQRTDGALIPIEDSAAPIRDDAGNLIGVVLVFRDVTNERKSQDLLRKSEKLSAAARLSATVAHEINNPLEAVGNLIYIARNDPGASADAVRHLELAEQELERVAHITRQTLGFYRESHEPEPIEMPALIDAVLRLFSNKLKAKNITIERHYNECPRLLGVSGELKQVISNLVSNSIDAVPVDGQIRIELHCIEEGAGHSIQVLVEDNGPGVPPEIIERIFEPFFTTKKEIGNGLGLWVTREIVERHGGTIAARSAAAVNGSLHGASFTIVLPCEPDRESRRHPTQLSSQ